MDLNVIVFYRFKLFKKIVYYQLITDSVKNSVKRKQTSSSL